MERYPERGELVVASVDRVVGHGAYVRLDEYADKPGIVSIREFSLKWVKNPRDYFKEGQKTVLKVVGVNRARGHIDLSLKSVNENERRNKLKEFKLDRRMRKLMDHFAERLKMPAEGLYTSFGDRLFADYGSLYEAFREVSNGREDLKEYIKDGKLRAAVLDLIKENIKPTRVSISGLLSIRSDDGMGVDIIRKAMSAGEGIFGESVMGGITYVSAPNYRIEVTAEDYKTAERYLKDCYELITKESHGAECEFKREKQ
jgi:translation initiation factor 2 subunit 1